MFCPECPGKKFATVQMFMQGHPDDIPGGRLFQSEWDIHQVSSYYTTILLYYYNSVVEQVSSHGRSMVWSGRLLEPAGGYGRGGVHQALARLA